MVSMLQDKNTYNKIIIKTLPLTLVATTAYAAVLVGVISLVAVCLSTVAVCLLKPLLNVKTADFAKIIISVGIVGALTMIASVYIKELSDSVSLYLPLISLTTVLLVSGEETIQNTVSITFKYSFVIGAVSTGFLFVVGILRELLGLGSFFGLDVYTKVFAPMEFFKNPAGALFICAILTIIYNLFVSAAKKRGAK